MSVCESEEVSSKNSPYYCSSWVATNDEWNLSLTTDRYDKITLRYIPLIIGIASFGSSEQQKKTLHGWSWWDFPCVESCNLDPLESTQDCKVFSLLWSDMSAQSYINLKRSKLKDADKEKRAWLWDGKDDVMWGKSKLNNMLCSWQHEKSKCTDVKAGKWLS